MFIVALAILQEVEIVHRAETWERLVEVAEPSATIDRELLLWCRPREGAAWDFTLAAAFSNSEGLGPGWYVLRAGDCPWWRSRWGGAFLMGRASFPSTYSADGDDALAETIGPGGDLFKIACESVPGGAHGNQFLQVVLARRDTEGPWSILWRGTESHGWNMGAYCVSEEHGFAQRDGSIEVTYRETKGSGHERDWPEAYLVLNRSGVLAGEPPMRIDWTTPLQYEAAAGETWESVATKASNYETITPDDLKRRNPALAGRELSAGDRLVLDASDH